MGVYFNAYSHNYISSLNRYLKTVRVLFHCHILIHFVRLLCQLYNPVPMRM